MSDNIVPDLVSYLQEETDEFKFERSAQEQVEELEFKRIRDELRTKTPEQLEAMGLGVTPVRLSLSTESPPVYELWRTKSEAWIAYRPTNTRYLLAWDDQNRGEHEGLNTRFKVRVADIKAVPDFEDYLLFTGLLSNITPGKTSGVYLSRLSMAMRGVPVANFKANGHPDALEVDHRDNCPYHDNWENLTALPRSEHLRLEARRTKALRDQVQPNIDAAINKDVVLEELDELLYGEKCGEERRGSSVLTNLELLEQLGQLDDWTRKLLELLRQEHSKKSL